MNGKVVGIAVGAIAAIAAGLYFIFGMKPDVQPAVSTPVAQTPPAIANAVPTPTEPQALPALDGSDELATNELIALLGQPFVQKHLVPKDLIRHVVTTIDNLPRKKVASQVNPVVPVAGQVNAQNEVAVALTPENFARYDEFINTVNNADSKQLVAAYFKLYPLFQEAYQSLGYPNKYFNDRLVAVLDHLIATPYAKQPIQLVNGPGIYQFADPALENLSAGQKIIVRIGPDHGAKVRAKLKEIRALVATGVPARN